MFRWPAFLLVTFPLCSWAQLSPGTWRTDLSKHSVDLSEIVVAGPKKDGIPSIDHPKFVSSAEAATWLDAAEPVIVVELHGEARAYPFQILIWHLMVNDQIGPTPILVSFSVLCNYAVVYDRRVRDTPYEFGFSGMVRDSNSVLFDRPTDSLWQQLSGEAVAGNLTGAKLTRVNSQVAPFRVFTQTYPNGKVLSRDTGYHRAYGQNPYARFVSTGHMMFPVKLVRKPAIPPMETMVVVEGGRYMRAYPSAVLADRHVLGDTIDGRKFVILCSHSMLDLLNAPNVAEAGETLAAGVFWPEIDGKSLSFYHRSGAFFDRQTRSRWSLLGVATKGPLAGKRLKPARYRIAFAFPWLALHPDTVLVSGPAPAVPYVGESPFWPYQNPNPAVGTPIPASAAEPMPIPQ